MDKLKLYVFSNEYKEAKGVYEEDEIGDFFKYYIEEVINGIEEHYSIYERIEYHYKNIGLLVEYFNKNYIENDSELDEFLKIYNEIANEKLEFESILVDEDNQQLVTEFIFKNGIEKYKANKGKDLLPKVEVLWNRKFDESLVLSEYQKDVHKIIKLILIKEIDRVYKDYCAEQLLFEKSDYLRDLLKIKNALDDFRKDNMEVLFELYKIYNDEFESAENELIINTRQIS